MNTRLRACIVLGMSWATAHADNTMLGVRLYPQNFDPAHPDVTGLAAPTGWRRPIAS